MEKELKEELVSRKTRTMSDDLSKMYLRAEEKRRKAIQIIRDSIRSRRDCYPFCNVPRTIRKKICILNYMIHAKH